MSDMRAYLEARQERSLTCNKLQAHKSSFQAWKCVSFGCSLLALVLLLSKLYEVSTDLQLLLGIDRLLALNERQQWRQPDNSSSSGPPESLSWPPVPLAELLPSVNESSGSFGMESLSSNDSMLMSHMQMNLNRELNGDQLLRQEVDMFIVEFKNAKSTLSLSCLLVIVYLISWILMTLAINDARISNDISLRNILLLSTFGAIDIAASVGFVMVRIIMYNVKNRPFASDLIGSAGLKDTPIRLSADQVTAFTALRMVSMRSCSAYMDIYVSVVVGLLTVLRLYAILRALTYYRRLRQLSDSTLFPAADLVPVSAESQPQQRMLGQPHGEKSIWALAGGHTNRGEARFRPNSGTRRRSQERPRQLVSSSPMFYGNHCDFQMAEASMRKAASSGQLSEGDASGEPRQPLVGRLSRPRKMFVVAQAASSSKTIGRMMTAGSYKQRLSTSLTRPAEGPLLVEAPAGSALQIVRDQQVSARRKLSKDQEEEAMRAVGAQREPENLASSFSFERSESSSEANLLSSGRGRVAAKREREQELAAFNTVRSNGTTYALLTAEQLGRLAKRIQRPAGSADSPARRSIRTTGGSLNSNNLTKYKLLSKYRQSAQARARTKGGSVASSQLRNDSGLAACEELDLSSLSNSTLTSCEGAHEDSDVSREIRATVARRQEAGGSSSSAGGGSGNELLKRKELLSLDKILQMEERKSQLEREGRGAQVTKYYYA